MRTIMVMLGTLALTVAAAQAEPTNRIDVQRPDAPELAAFGPHAVGVRTLELVDEGRPDVANADGEDVPTYDRPLTLELWYPADLPPGMEPGGTYTVTTRDGTTQAELQGRAVRDAEPAAADEAPFPLVVLSHGYPGNRFLLSHLGENLASKGYVVASIDHTDSTYADQAAFASTLYNRPLDQLFVIDELARRAGVGDDWLSGLVDAERTALIGYSMGGYGVVNAIGGGFAPSAAELDFAPPGDLLEERTAGDERFEASLDGRIGAAIAIAPWGMQAGFWDAEGLEAIEVPVLFMAGSLDETSGYENGTRALWAAATGTDRALLTFENAKHNAAAPIPAPREVWDTGRFDHYADAVWDTVRMNNIAQHFATAFLDLHLKDDEDAAAYLDLIPVAAEGTWSVDEDGEPTDEHTFWLGFPEGTAAGLTFERLGPGEVPTDE